MSFNFESAVMAHEGNGIRTMTYTHNDNWLITGDDAASAMTELYAQLSDPESPMMNGEATGQLVPGQTPVVNMVCPKGTYRAEGESSCTSCNGGYEPNDAQDGCLKCVESRGGNGYSGLEFYSAGDLCQLCAPGKVPKQDEFGNKVDCVACDDGLFAPAASDRCSPCPLRQQPNAEKSACACAAGTYNATMGQIMCFEGTSNYEADLFRYPDHDYPTHDGCVPCDETCMDCATGVPLMLPGYLSFTQKLPKHCLTQAVTPMASHCCLPCLPG